MEVNETILQQLTQNLKDENMKMKNSLIILMQTDDPERPQQINHIIPTCSNDGLKPAHDLKLDQSASYELRIAHGKMISPKLPSTVKHNNLEPV